VSVYCTVPPVCDGHDAGAVVCDAEEGRHGEVEVVARRVAPPAGVRGQPVVGRAEVGGRDHHRRHGGVALALAAAPATALDLEAGAAGESVVEERRAERPRRHAVPRDVEVAVPAGAAHGARRVAATIHGHGGVRALLPRPS